MNNVIKIGHNGKRKKSLLLQKSKKNTDFRNTRSILENRVNTSFGNSRDGDEEQEPFLARKLYPTNHDNGELDLVTEIPRQMIPYLIGLNLVEAAMDETRTVSLATVAQRVFKSLMVSVNRKGREELIRSAQAEVLGNQQGDVLKI